MRFLPLPCRMALCNIRRNPRRSLITILAISFGLFCLIVFQGMKAGLHREMIAGTINLDAGAVQIHAAGYEANHVALRPLANPARLTATLPRAGITAWAPRIKAPALILAGPNSSSIILTGIDPALEAGVTFIRRKIVGGDYLVGAKSILLGKELADSLGAGIGDPVTLMSRDLFGHPATGKFVIGGLFATGLSSFNRSRGYISLQDARQLFGMEPQEVTEISLGIAPEAAPAKAAALRTMLEPGKYQVLTWQEIAADVKQLIDLNDATMNLLVIIVFAMVAMGIINTMNAIIYERFREFGVLATIGTTPAGIIGLVALESFFLALAAALLGSAAGSLACLYLARVGLDLTRFTSENQYFADTHVLKAYLLAGDLWWANAITVATSLAAALYPATKAAGLDPVTAISHT